MNISRRELRKGRHRRAEEDEAARVSVKLARVVRLAGVSRSATARLQVKLKTPLKRPAVYELRSEGFHNAR
jgi:hypothetical protein